ncbi:response regulator [Gilvimarinus algae]|uniref:Response regulator n=1 Tax=Gilvimarinus algae TaxID=3058037 RepID=A0ABT8TGH3_9GAMM|nr:response regulator [Gilvimarinus sp. SDUM040014]MDO3383100.1 response regulator [Gilvimarinus sp. SDUM040014]
MTNRETILLVEDNPDEAELARLAFGRIEGDYDLHIVNTGEEAMRVLFAYGQCEESALGCKPALILLDIDLPRLSGFELLRQLRASADYQHTPVVFLTTSDESRDVARGYSLGVNSYLLKPLDFERFTELLQSVSNYWLKYNTRVH